jgi:hypothetical protein
LDAIVGRPCEAALVAGTTLVLATPEGHWAWKVEDALAGRVEAIRRTWRAADAGAEVRAAIDRRAENQEAFANPGQVFLEGAPGEPFYWHFRTDDGRARSYRVNPADLAVDDRFEYDGLAPVGLAVRPGQDRPSLIFERSDELFEERVIRGRLAPCQVTLPGEGRAGLQLVATLIVTIGNARGDARARQIEIQSLWGGRPPIRVDEVPGLASDPFVWSGHVFTVERPGENRLTLVRRALKSAIEVP